MNNLKFSKLAIEYKSLQDMRNGIDDQMKGIRKQMLTILRDNKMDEYSYEGAKASVIRSERNMILKEKLIKKFGEDNLKDCTKIIRTETVRINYKEVE
jgi:predicted nucleotidyltransferase